MVEHPLVAASGWGEICPWVQAEEGRRKWEPVSQLVLSQIFHVCRQTFLSYTVTIKNVLIKKSLSSNILENWDHIKI